MIDIIPGILEKNLPEIEHKIYLVEHLVNWVQVDVLDGTLIDNQTYNNWKDFQQFRGRVNMEGHLMVDKPARYIDPMAKSGFDRLIAHVEATGDVREFLEVGKRYQIELGLALDASSDIELVEPYLGEIDCVLLMMYQAGKSGQKFQKEQLSKIQKIHNHFPDLPIEVDGGIDNVTAPLVKSYGATRLVSTSFLFWKNAERIAEAIEELRK